MVELAARWSFAAVVDACSHSVRTSKKPVTSLDQLSGILATEVTAMRRHHSPMVTSIRLSFAGLRESQRCSADLCDTAYLIVYRLSTLNTLGKAAFNFREPRQGWLRRAFFFDLRSLDSFLLVTANDCSKSASSASAARAASAASLAFAAAL